MSTAPAKPQRIRVVSDNSRYTALGYQAASRLSDAGYTATGGSGDYQMRYDRPTLINISRKMDRDNWLYETTLNRAADYILGVNGFGLQAQTGVDGSNKRIEQELWPRFVEAPELRGVFDWAAVQETILRELWVAGDTLCVKLGDKAGDDAGKIQHIEAERIDASQAQDGDDRIEQGVILNKRGQIVGFKVAGVSPAGWVRPGDTQTILAEDAIFTLNRVKRLSQTRGVPILVSSMPLGQRLDDILTSEAIAWQTMSRLAVAITRGDESDSLRPPILEGENAEVRSSTETADLEKVVTEIGYNIIYQGREGDKIAGVQQNRPPQHFEQSVKLFIRMFGVPLGIPMEIILLDWGKMNYSSARTVLLQAFLNFRRWQQILVRRFYVPLYRWLVGRWVAQGELVWRPNLLKHTWEVPSWPWIDEDKEVKAWTQKIDRGLATQTEALASLSKNHEEQLDERKVEIERAWSTAQEIEESTAGGITAAEVWRHLAGLDEGRTERARKQQAKDQDDDDSDEGQDRD